VTRVALFGCGWIQDFHARGVQACGHEVVAASIDATTCPDRRSVSIGAEPLYGTWIALVPVFSRKSSIPRCSDEPVPDEPYGTLPGWAFSQATNSAIDFAGTCAAFTTSTSGVTPTIEIAAKSFTGW